MDCSTEVWRRRSTGHSMLGEQGRLERKTGCEEAERDVEETRSPAHIFILVLKLPLFADQDPATPRCFSLSSYNRAGANDALPTTISYLIQNRERTHPGNPGTGGPVRPDGHGKLRHGL